MQSFGIILAAGSGKRFSTQVKKQYVQVHGRPLLYYTLLAFEQSPVDHLVVVAGKEDMDYVRREIVKQYGFQKVQAVVEGGQERYDSVYQGLLSIPSQDPGDIVLIHDGARAMVTPGLIRCMILAAKEHRGAVPVIPLKDTVRSRQGDFGGEVLDRSSLCLVQTPQSFELTLCKRAYALLFAREEDRCNITDDAMVVERFTGQNIRLVQGDPKNIKVTAPEDLEIAQLWLEKV